MEQIRDKGASQPGDAPRRTGLQIRPESSEGPLKAAESKGSQTGRHIRSTWGAFKISALRLHPTSTSLEPLGGRTETAELSTRSRWDQCAAKLDSQWLGCPGDTFDYLRFLKEGNLTSSCLVPPECYGFGTR